MKEKPKAQQIRATANLKGQTVRIEVATAGRMDVLWLDRGEASNFISELRAAYKAIVAGPADSHPVEDGNL